MSHAVVFEINALLLVGYAEPWYLFAVSACKLGARADMEDVIHKSGPVERWRWSSWRPGAETDPAPSRGAPAVAQALRRTLDVLIGFPDALDAVQIALREFMEAPS